MSSPFEQYEKAHPEHWDCLYDIPPWEWESIVEWIHKIFVVDYDEYGSRGFDYTDQIVGEIQKKYRIMFRDIIGIRYNSWDSFHVALESKYASHDELSIVFVVELIVKFVRDDHVPVDNVRCAAGRSHEPFKSKDLLFRLDGMLSNGSKWRVVFEHGCAAGLVERVDERIVNMAKEIDNNYLNDAWFCAFGASTSSYSMAVKHAVTALEEVLSAAGISGGTLGNKIKWIRENNGLRMHNVADKQLSMRANEHFTPETIYKWLQDGLDIVQKTDTERHGGNSDRIRVAREPAQQAVIVATVLCELVTKKYFVVDAENVS